MARKRKKTFNLYEIVLESEDDPLRKQFSNLQAFEYGELRILMGRNDTLGVYLNISCRSRWPTIEEVMHLRGLLIASEIRMAIMVPLPTQQTSGSFQLHVHQIQEQTTIPVYNVEGKMLGKEPIKRNGPND